MILLSCSSKDPLNYGVLIYKCPDTFNNNSSIKYKVSSNDNHFSLPSSSFQQIIKKDISRNRVTITVLISNNSINNEKLIPMSFKETRFITLKNKEIIKIAQKIMKKHSSVSQRIRAVENFVYNHIKNKEAGISLIPADMVFTGQSGDCTEHTVLTITLLHIMKIPSKAKIGLILKKGKQNCGSMIFHMWAQAWNGKKWQYVDSSIPSQSSLPSRYIVLGNHSLKTEMPLSYLKTISAIKHLQISIIE